MGDHVLYLSHSLSTVTMLLHSLIAVLLKLLLLLLTRSPASAGTTTVVGNSCGTDQNPYCAGNSVLEQLCCPYPNVCYWQNRNGDPGCCPAGQWCDGSYPTHLRTIQPLYGSRRPLAPVPPQRLMLLPRLLGTAAS